LRRPDPGFDPALARYHFSKWSPRPDFRRAHLSELKRRVSLVIDAHVVALHPGPDHRVSAIEIASWNGRHLRLPVNQLVLAQGGIETCRQLLLAARAHPGFFGDASGWLGHAFMEHPSIDAGALSAPDPEALQRIFGARVRHGRKYSVRLSTPEAWQRSRSLLNASATFFPRYPRGVDSPYGTLRRFLRRPSAAGVRPVASAATRLPRALATLLRSGLVLQPGAELRLAMMVEQAPDRANRLSLAAAAADHFHQPRVSLRWQIGENSWRTLHAFVHTVDREFARLGLGRVSMPPELAGPEPGSPADALLSDVNHHMGGARLSARPEDGVVSPDLRLWSQENVFVCSTAVFPTGSHSNPTLTLLSLAHRLARHLSR
jgi:choline dehydrogenase-like flavoprotein